MIYLRPDHACYSMRKLVIKSQVFLKHTLYKIRDSSINRSSISLFYTVRHCVYTLMEKKKKTSRFLKSIKIISVCINSAYFTVILAGVKLAAFLL